jgi:hypothetical protein
MIRSAVPRRSAQVSKRFADEASRRAKHLFESSQRAEILARLGHPPESPFIVVVRNQFVPIESLPGCGLILRKFTRGTRLDEAGQNLLRTYWAQLDATQKLLAKMLDTDGYTTSTMTWVRKRDTWPAIGVAHSEQHLRALFIEQFERIARAQVAWRWTDSSTYDYPMANGAYLLAVIFWMH